jgi:hypothetical protein
LRTNVSYKIMKPFISVLHIRFQNLWFPSFVFQKRKEKISNVFMYNKYKQ